MMIDRNNVLEKFNKVYLKDFKKGRDLIKKLDYKKDHYLLSRIALSYLDEGKLRLAERYIVKAFEINPYCSNVLWILGIVRWDYGQIDSAIFCFEEIINIGIKGIVKYECHNSKEIGLAQINDSKFQLYRLLKEREPLIAKKYLTMYKMGLQKGISTLYEPIEKFL